jgi:hypothetical protein
VCRFSVFCHTYGGRLSQGYNKRNNSHKEKGYVKKISTGDSMVKWTDLKVGDIIKKEEITAMVTIVYAIDNDKFARIYAGNSWLSDKELENWEKVK